MTKAKIVRVCKECSVSFEVYPSRATANFCSMKCVYANLKTRETENRQNVNCDACGVQFRLYNNRLKTKNNFCSTQCHDDFRKKQVEFSCEVCATNFTVKKSKSEQSNTRYCSMKCRNEGFNGENSPLFTKKMRFCQQCGEEFFANNYDPGKFCSNACRFDSQKRDCTQANIKFYGLPFWHKLRKECFKRDGAKCTRCSTTERRLHAHHIIPRRRNGLDELSNLTTLCDSCHTIVESETEKQHQLELN